MKVTFNDFYGQYVTIHNETGSGNIMLCVKTCENMNEVRKTREEDCQVETDISMNEAQLTILYGAIKSMLEDDR